LCAFGSSRASLHKANIWRRCSLQDNWAKLNRTENMTDEKVAKVAAKTMVFQTLVAGLREGGFISQLR
jgi:Non-repetitive/WGA-negative nucleoporin C-terminal